MPDIVGEGLVMLVPDSSAFLTQLNAEVTAATQAAGAAISTGITAELNRAAAAAGNLSSQMTATAAAAERIGAGDLVAVSVAAENAASALVDAATGAELLEDGLSRASREAAAVNSVLDAIDSQDLDVAATAAQLLALSLDAVVAPATAIDAALRAIDSNDLDQLTASANAAASALLDVAAAAQLAEVAVNAIDPGDLALVFGAANSAAGQLQAMAAAALAVDAAINSIDTTELLAVIAAAQGARASLAQLAAASAAANRGLADGSVGLTGFNAGLSRTQLLAIAAGVALAALGGYGAYVAGKFEQVDVAFTGILGSAEKADALIAELQQFAATTPFQFEGLNEAARKLLGVGFAAEEIIPTLTTLGDIAAVLGVSEAQIAGVVRALGQIEGKGRVMGQELNQISEQLPGFSAIRAIAEGLGISVGEAFARVEDGAVDAETGIQLLLDGMAQFPGAAGAMEAQSQTLLGRLSTFKDVLTLTLGEAFQPLADQMKVFLEPLSEALAGPLTELGPILAGAFGLVSRALMVLLPTMEELLREAGPGFIAVFDAVASVVEALGPALGDLARTAGTLLTALAPLIVAVANLLTPLAEGLAVVTAFGDGLGAIVLIAAALAVPLAGYVTTMFAAAGATSAATLSVTGLTTSIAGLTTAIAANPVGLLIVGLTAVSVLLAKVVMSTNEATISTEAYTAEVERLDSAFYGQAESIAAASEAYRTLSADVGEYAMEQGILSDPRFADDIDRIGVSAAELGRQLQTGEAGLKSFVAAAVTADEVTLKQWRTVDGYRRAVELTADEIRNYDGSLVELLNSGQLVIDGNVGVIEAFIAQENAVRAANQATFESLVADGQLSQAQADLILSLDEVTGSTDTYGAALAALPDHINAVNDDLSRLDIPLGQQAASWAALAQAIGQNRIAVDDYGTIAEKLGVEADVVKDFAGDVNDALDDIVDNAVSQLPTAGTALDTFTDAFIEANQRIVDDINENRRKLLPEGQEWSVDMEVKMEDLQSFKQLTYQDIANFTKEIDKTATSIDEFDSNLAAIRAVSEPVADFLAQQGPEAAGKMAAALAAMPASIEPLAASLANLQTQTDEFAASIKQAAIDSPADAANLAARMTSEFEVNLDFVGVTERELARVNALLTGDNIFAIYGNLVGGISGLVGQGIRNALGLYAEGGIFSTPTAGIIGEAGTEYLLPENDPARSADLLSQAPAPYLADLFRRLAPRSTGGPAGGLVAAPAGGAVAPSVDLSVSVAIDARGADPDAVKGAAAAGVRQGAADALREALVLLRTQG